MPRHFAACIAGLVFLTGLADEPAADAVLKEKALRKAGSVYVLAAEADVQKKVVEARAVSRRMTQALAQQRAYELAIREGRQVVRDLTEQRIALNNQLSQATTVAQHNQLVAQVNELTDRLNLLTQQEADPEAKRKIEEQAALRREEYIQAVLDLRRLVDDAKGRYAALAQDDGVRDALERLNRRGKEKVSLGPSRAFLANVKLLEKAEASVLSESVALRKEGGIFWVDVTFNGKVTRPMAFDTGAAEVVLPADLAAQIGLKPGRDAPTVRCRIADGSTVEAKRMTVPSMRVGRFTVADVPCVVMPADKGDVPPLLGQTFQRHFLLKFSPDAGTLVLSKVEVGEEASPRTPAGKRKERSP
jgi:clan AA aspartic protease (TIGR02281 family)